MYIEAIRTLVLIYLGLCMEFLVLGVFDYKRFTFLGLRTIKVTMKNKRYSRGSIKLNVVSIIANYRIRHTQRSKIGMTPYEITGVGPKL